jgi:hypothetical protein
MTLLLAALLLQDLETWLSKVKKEDRAAIEKELARFDAPEAADEVKFRPQEFEILSKVGAHPYEAVVPVMLAAVAKAGSPRRRFALGMLGSKMPLRGSVAEADLAWHNLAIVRAIPAALDDADVRVRRAVGLILFDIADGDVLATEPPKTVAPGENVRAELAAAFAKVAADRNPGVRALAELGASVLKDDALERLRLRAEVDHYLEHLTREDATVPDMPVAESKKIRDGVKASLEKVGDRGLVVTLACEAGKGSETEKQLVQFFKLDEGEWISTIKDPRKKK